MTSLLDPSNDERIRAALRDADAKGKLDVVVAVTGFGGTPDDLRKIMNSTDDLDAALSGAEGGNDGAS